MARPISRIVACGQVLPGTTHQIAITVSIFIRTTHQRWHEWRVTHPSHECFTIESAMHWWFAQTISNCNWRSKNTSKISSSGIINETSAGAASADILQIITVPVWVVAVFVEPNWLQICWPQQSNELMCMAVPNHCTLTFAKLTTIILPLLPLRFILVPISTYSWAKLYTNYTIMAGCSVSWAKLATDFLVPTV